MTNSKGELVVIARSGEIVIHDEHGRERERHKVPYGAVLAVKADQPIKAGAVLANWDPLTRPIITEFAGKVKFENVEEGLTVAQAGRRGDRPVHPGGDRVRTRSARPRWSVRRSS